MTTLSGFPLVNQRTTVTGDGRASENALFDCVAACIDAMCRYWLKTPENSVFNPDHFKDVAYGENWRNDGTDAARYVDFCKSLGINLHMITADSPAHVLMLAQDYINKGVPCTFTELDPYVDTNLPQYAGWTHACCFFGFDNGGMTALDPFIGKALYKSNSAWTDVLRSNQLWIAERIEPLAIPNGWHDTGEVLTSPNGVPVVLGFRDYVLANNWDAANVPLGPQYYTQQLEQFNPELGDGDQLVFLFGDMLGYPHNPQGAMASLKDKVIHEWAGKELNLTRDLLAKYYPLAKQVPDLQAQITTLSQQLTEAKAAQVVGLDASKVADRLTALGLQIKQGQDALTQAQNLIVQPIS